MKEKLIASFRARYGRNPVVIARAPGRLEFIGNHTDYNGGTVLGVSIDRSVWVAVAPHAEAEWRLGSETHPEIITVPATNAPAKQSGPARWANYPLGVIAALPKFGLRRPEGFDFLAASDLPSGAGLSSSAALELASALALLALSGQQAAREVVVQLCRHAENEFVGVPCGVLDQGVSGFGREHHLVFIDCRGPKFATVPLPEAARFWVFNTHTKHALVDGLYAARHRECMAAAKALGVALLADATPASVVAARDRLPALEFKRARHVVEEIARVDATVLALRAGDLVAAGKLADPFREQHARAGFPRGPARASAARVWRAVERRWIWRGGDGGDLAGVYGRAGGGRGGSLREEIWLAAGSATRADRRRCGFGLATRLGSLATKRHKKGLAAAAVRTLRL